MTALQPIAGATGAAGAGALGVDVWASQGAGAASVTDWGTIINALIAAGNPLLNFGKHDFPFTTPLDLNQSSLFGQHHSLALVGSGGVGWCETGNFNSAPTRLIWKGGAGSGFTSRSVQITHKAAVCVGSNEGTRISDLGLYYDNAAFDGVLLGLEGAQGVVERCNIGAWNFANKQAKACVSFAGSNMNKLLNCGLAGALSVIRGYETGVDVSDGIDIIGCTISTGVNAMITNPGRMWTIRDNNIEFGFGAFHTPKCVTGDLGPTPGGQGQSSFAFRDNRVWDGDADQICIDEPNGANWSFTMEHNLIAVGAACKLRGGQTKFTHVTIRHNDFGVVVNPGGGDPYHIDLGTWEREVEVSQNSGTGTNEEPTQITGLENHAIINYARHMQTLCGYERAASRGNSGGVTLSLHAAVPNVSTVSLQGNQIAGLLKIVTTGGGTTGTGPIFDVALSPALTAPPSPIKLDRMLIWLEEYYIPGITNTNTITVDPYPIYIDNSNFQVGFRTAMPASKAVWISYRILMM